MTKFTIFILKHIDNIRTTYVPHNNGVCLFTFSFSLTILDKSKTHNYHQQINLLAQGKIFLEFERLRNMNVYILAKLVLFTLQSLTIVRTFVYISMEKLI